VSTRAQIFWLRVKMMCRVDVRRAIDMLLAAGAEFAKAMRFVAAVRAA
jgi:hypothetical protein